MIDRSAAIERFYHLLGSLSKKVGGPLKLSMILRNELPERGVYFFFEQGEKRTGNSSEDRVVRVGTHGLKLSSKSTLFGRLMQHRGTTRGGGNHRGSVFRLHVGKALLNSGIARVTCNSWSKGSSAPQEIRLAEHTVETVVSQYIGNMKVLWIAVGDEPGPISMRGFIERNAIGLLAGQEPASADWLGFHTGNPSVIRSFLWSRP